MNVDFSLVRLLFLAMFLLPVPALVAALRSWQVQNQVAWWTLALFTIVYALTLHLSVVWPQTSMALRPLMWVLVGITLASGWRLPQLPVGSLTLWPAMLLVITVLLLPTLFRAWQGHKILADAVALGPVLAGGTFYVEVGGSHPSINYHMNHNSLRYAVDFIGIGPLGRHANGILPADPAQYVIYGAAVLAPMNAVVEKAVDGLPDIPGPHRDAQNPAGNHIVLLLENDTRIALAHLKQGSIRVKPGQSVKTGQVMAQVGHSGNSTEPHLHLGVVKGDPWTGEGLPFTIEGRFPIRGMIYQKKSGQ